MINLFRKKYKRSDYMEGLLLAEDYINNGKESEVYLWNAIYPSYLKFLGKHLGFIDYVEYNKNILSKL